MNKPIHKTHTEDPKKTPDEFPELGNNESYIDPLELKLLDEASLHSTDNDGEPLNEKSSAEDEMGADLDVPGSENDDADEAIGEEDEENNSYTLKDGDE